jgi:6-phospho-3-hexuloisomerase
VVADRPRAQELLGADGSVAEPCGGQARDLQLLWREPIEQLERPLVRRNCFAGRSQFAHRLMHLGVDSHVVGDVTCPAVVDDDLMVLISGSGTTSTTVRQARIARKVGATGATVTAVADSELSAQADIRLVVPVDAAVSCQFVSTLFSQCVQLIFDGICMQLTDTWGREHGYLYARHSNLE